MDAQAAPLPAFSPWAYQGIGAILISGVINILSKPGRPPHYRVWFGAKILLALQLFGVALTYTGKQRLLTGALITAVWTVGISEVLRFTSLP